MNTDDLKEALESKSLTALTKAIGRVANSLAYALKPPHTEVLQLSSKEESDGYSVRFEARLRLHYSASEDGLVFIIEFGGDALSDTPSPLLHDLFYAAVVRQVNVYGYGSAWMGKTIATPQEFTQHLEVTSPTVNEIEMNEFFDVLQGVPQN
jgi:hypothetical protein